MFQQAETRALLSWALFIPSPACPSISHLLAPQGWIKISRPCAGFKVENKEKSKKRAEQQKKRKLEDAGKQAATANQSDPAEVPCFRLLQQ